MVEGNKTITGKITLTGDVNLILRDGAELTISGKIDGGTTKSLTIYGQESGTGKLTIDGGGNINSQNIKVKDLQIHGGDITGTNSEQAIITNGTLKIYHGTISATAKEYGLVTYGDLCIYGGTITASTTASSAAKYAIYVYNTAMEMTGGSLTAISTGANNHGIYVAKNINISGGTINATGGSCTSGTGNGGTGIFCNSGDIAISGTAYVTAKGGDGTVNPYHGGYGLYAHDNHSIEISGGTVNAIGGGGPNGHAIYTTGNTGNVSIKGGTVTATATGSAGNGIDSYYINYYGGQAEATGAEGGRGIYGTLTNLSGYLVPLKTKQNGGEADWTSSSIGPYSESIPTTLTFRCIKINM